MNQQIMYSICFIIVVLISAVTPQTGGTDEPSGRRTSVKPVPCNAPDRAIVTPSSTSKCGVYPTYIVAERIIGGGNRSTEKITELRNDIKKYLARSSIKRRFNSVKKTSSAFCRRKLSILPIAAVAGKPGRRWAEVCPSSRRYYRFPTCIIYLGQKCFMLRPWVNLECQYTICRQRSCKNIKMGSPAEAGVATTVHQCRHTNHRTVSYYIWCPKLLKVFRRIISLSQCCSCMSKWCVFGG